MKLNYRWLFFIVCALAFVIFVKKNSEISVEAKDDIKGDIYIEDEVEREMYVVCRPENTIESKVNKSFAIEQDLELKEIVKKVVDNMSSMVFDGLPIDVRIEDRNSKKVAIVDLRERIVEEEGINNSEFKKLYDKMIDKSGTWQSYFTTNEIRSKATLRAIEDTLSQKGCLGKWIDGYMIYHNGETLEDHRNLSTTKVTWLKK